MSRLLALMRSRIETERAKPTLVRELHWHEDSVVTSEDFQRIKALPQRDVATVMTPAHVEMLSAELRTSRGTMELRPLQVAALLEAARCGGLLGLLSVGSGKTLVSFLLPWVMRAQRTMVFTNPKLVQPMLNEFHRYTLHWKSDTSSVKVVPYSKLSGKKSGNVIDEYGPDLLILDEASSVADADSVRTRRLKRYLDAHPRTKVVALSGTMTQRALEDFEHLAWYTLRQGSPVPHYPSTLREWGRAINAGVKAGARLGPGVLKQFMLPEDTDARQGFQRRLVATPGVVASASNELGTSLVFAARPLELPESAGTKIYALEKDWKIEEGVEFMEAGEVAVASRQLACGFFYRWKWPNDVVDKEWLLARSLWASEVRTFLRAGSKRGIDSPALVYNACERGELQFSSFEMWKLFKPRPKPDSVPVWISDFMVADAVAWGKESPGIIWYEHKALGEAIAKAGNFKRYGAQLTGGADIEKEPGTRTIVVSIDSYFKGVNLQYAFNRNLVTTPPASGERWEQFVGRTHRENQKADEVTVDCYLHTANYRNSLRQALDEERYAEQTTGSKRKLLYGTKLWGNI